MCCSSGARMLGRALLQTATTHTLQHLNLRCNGATLLAQAEPKPVLAAVGSSTTLTSLHLARNDLRCETLALVNSALTANQRASQMDLTCNPLLACASKTTCLGLVEVVRVHASVVSLGSWTVLNLDEATATQLRSTLFQQLLDYFSNYLTGGEYHDLNSIKPHVIRAKTMTKHQKHMLEAWASGQHRIQFGTREKFTSTLICYDELHCGDSEDENLCKLHQGSLLVANANSRSDSLHLGVPDLPIS
jgi:hypothetical protein